MNLPTYKVFTFPEEAEPAEFYCRECDGNKVHSEKPDTGMFFSAFGHIWDGKLREEYPMIIFAQCSECLGVKPRENIVDPFSLPEEEDPYEPYGVLSDEYWES